MVKLHLLGWIFVFLQIEVIVSRRVSGPEVYFRARLTWDSRIPVGSTVRFDQVELQIGKAYNPTTGVFVAPVSGLYQFMFHAQSRTGGASSYILMNQGKQEIVTTISSAWDCSSYTTIIYVKKGHHVSVKKTYDDGNAKMNDSTQFSGYLLRGD